MCCTRSSLDIGRTQKIAGTIAQLCRAISSQLRHVSTIEKTCQTAMSTTCPHNMVNFGSLATEICWRVWGTTANFNGFRVLAALLHAILVVSVSQTLRRWTEGACTYIRQGGHHVGHWPTFIVVLDLVSSVLRQGIVWGKTSPKLSILNSFSHVDRCNWW